MANVTLYTGAHCPYCVWAKRLLDEKAVAYEEIRVDEDREALVLMVEKSNRHSIPQIFIGDYHVGGYDELAALDREKKLDALLNDACANTEEE
ncbi:MAG: glutaredoxin 3 [Gammaproteobacteria bacterium]|nr:glutaredoxin 3 [Gammaproteobacteria bacterium]